MCDSCRIEIEEREEKHACGCGHCHGHEEEGGWLWPAVTLAMLVAGLVMEYSGVPDFFRHKWVEFGWYVAAFIPVGFGVMREAWEKIADRDFFNEFTLMSIASIGAFCIGEYPEGVAVMLFYCVGETLQDKAVDRVKDNINSLLRLKVRTVTVVKDGMQTREEPEKVAPGTTIYVRPGEKVALDGTLEDVEALFDTSALTGESLPRAVSRGGEVLAGMVPLSTPVTMRTERRYEDSALSKILRMVEEAQEGKPESVKFITRFARIYTPVVFFLAVALVGIPAIVGAVNPAFHYVFSEWLYRGLVFLVISCPCALVISVPLGYFVGIGAASKKGILVKGGNYLDLIRRAGTIAFDKTGTLTNGQVRVDSVTANGMTEDELLAIMAAAETASNHPLAKAVADYAAEKGIKASKAENVEEKAGCGVTALVEGRRVAAGNVKLMEREGVDYPAELKDVAETVIICGVDGKYAGYVTLGDDIKPEARDAVAALKRDGVEKLVILSGDSQPKADRTAGMVGIDEARGNLLPEHKAAYVKERAGRTGGSPIAYVGDGINDAPVLALSDVGIAMGGLGADIAVENADVVIQTDNLSRLPLLRRIARKTHAIIVENITFAIVVKVGIMVLGAMGFVSLWAAVFADVGVALIAIANALRIFKTGEK